ncbi:MAG: hypothetical protein IJA20_02540 [Methanocorpusculum sp.]|nr:hypothetical protein [Methanocorpusculum sp.]
MSSPNIVYEAYPKVSVQEFIPELSFEFTDMPENAFAHFILKAINNIARRGNVLRRTATIHTQDCVDNYRLEPQDCMDIVAVMGICKRDNCGCSPITRLTGQPCCLPCGSFSWFEKPNIIHISDARCGNCYDVKFSVAPTYDACEVDEILLTQYYDLVMDGVRADLYGMGNKPWSSLQRLEYHKQQFDKGIRKAAIETLTGGQRGALKARRPRMF